MKFTPTPIAGVTVVEQQQIRDERGYFARSWCQKEFTAQGLTARVVQANTAHSLVAGTLRGMHFQRAPHAETKVVYCSRGAVYDVAVDLRPGSASFRQWFGIELSAANGKSLVVPEGCAHGYLTLSDDTVLDYLTSEMYAPAAASGVRFDDLAFSITWPTAIRVVSQPDRAWPDFSLQETTS